MDKREFWDNVRKRIKDEREARGISREEMSQILRVTESFWALIEKGERGTTFFNIYRIAQTLGISLDSLVFGEHEQMADPKSRLRKRIDTQLSQMGQAELVYFSHMLTAYRQLKKDT
jgi:transcriptional regulator with XRE-family HTH domain